MSAENSEKRLRVIFMGTPEFAVASLSALLENNIDVVAVVTAPDKPAGRGLKLTPSPVKVFAEEKGLPVLQPEKLKNPEFIEQLKSFQPDLFVVVAFRMLPEIVWNLPPVGTINLHASLLPDYRGAAPINWVVMNGEKETGVTTFFITHEIDTGDLIFREKIAVNDDELAGELHDRMMEIGAQVLVKTVKAIESGEYPKEPQKADENLKKAPKIFREDCRINWNADINSIYNHIRGLSPYPAAWTMLDGKALKVYRAEKEISSHNFTPGTIQSTSNQMKIAVDGGFIIIKELQLEGKKRMSAEEFLRGVRLETSVIQ